MLVTYENFDLKLTHSQDIVATSPQGEVGPVRFQCDWNELKLALALVEREQTNPGLIRALGCTLFQALFPPEVLVHLERTREAAPDHRIRLRLCIEDPDQAALPWELIHDGEKFLGLDPDTSIVRYSAVNEPARSLSVDGPLRCLVVLASPSNFPALDRERIINSFKSVFGQYQKDGLLEVEFLEHATYTGLVSMLRSGVFHILHFIGYSGVDNATGQPQLLFEHENAAARRISAEELSGILYQEDMGRLTRQGRSLRLVILNDIETTTRGVKNYSPEVAASFLHNGIPSVIAMQNSLPERASNIFAREFYLAITHGLPVDLAVVKGRRAVDAEVSSPENATLHGAVVPGEWSAPVLLMHSEDGQLFHPQKVTSLVFDASSVEVYSAIAKFSVETRDRLTRFILDHLPAFAFFGFAGMLAYLVLSVRLSNQPDSMFISGIAVVFLAIWMLNNLFRRKMPETLDTLWRQRVINPRNGANLAREYLLFLQDYNRLLNHRVYLWATRIPVLAVAVFAALDFKSVAALPREWDTLLRVFLLIFEPLAGYVIGTLLWKMIATVIMTTRLSYRFDLDIRPSHPDKCGGLRDLGNLYFEHVRIILVAGFYVALWVVLVTFANPIMEQRVTASYPDQAALVENYPTLCKQNPSAPDVAAVCACLGSEAKVRQLSAKRQEVLRCIEASQNAPRSLEVSLAYNFIDFYRWRSFYSWLLGALALVAIATFIIPMYNTHRIMKRKSVIFQQKAHSIAGEIADLERYIEQRGTLDTGTSLDIRQRLEWLQTRYQQYLQAPTWPFDAQIRFRMLGSLGTMLFSWLLSEIVPYVISTLTR